MKVCNLSCHQFPVFLNLTKRTPLEISPRAFMGTRVILGFFNIHTCLLFIFFLFWLVYFILTIYLFILFIYLFIYLFFFVAIQLFLEFSPRTLVVHHLLWAHCSSRDGVARGEAFVTLRCQVHRWVSTWQLTGSFPWSGSECGESRKIKTYLFYQF